MKKLYTTLVVVFAIVHFSYGQWTNISGTGHYYLNSGYVGIGTTTIPACPLDVATLLNYGDLGTVLGRLPEGTGTGSGTFLGIRGYATQLGHGMTDWRNIKSFAIEHSFYGDVNSSINFYRGLGTTGGSMSFNTDNNIERVRITAEGNVGIGTTSLPSGGKLQVNGPIDNIAVNGNGAFRVYDGSNFAGGVGTDAWASSGSNTDFTVYTPNNLHLYTGGQKRITVINSGFVGIGTTSPDQKLTVNGTIHSKEVKVDTSIPVPDYVFEPAYQLPQLSALKTYLDANHHLPEIPSAAEIQKEWLESRRDEYEVA
ncbi:MAG: hypothetical protein JWQ34_311 [Mucilaginibacter sp.]|uniref:hypothetical protein n=1 Tax=Mucilaginibacter sp. TaxID=1882438 RepID=UPI00262CEDF5|nr:hypothetical protein [Mucilaginibacter sp.]MDB5002086.1 hypothetical protein [Mucilaginibacter sp.]